MLHPGHIIRGLGVTGSPVRPGEVFGPDRPDSARR